MGIPNKRQLMVGLAIVLTALIGMALPASAVAAKFFNTTSTVNNDGSLTVSFDERGLGNGNIDYTLTADASANYACINGGSKNPKASNKRTIASEVSANGSFESKNGRVVASLTTVAPAANPFECPPGQKLTLLSVTYTNIVLTDTTNGTSTTVDDVTRIFLTV